MSWKDAGWPYASRTALTLKSLEFYWRDEDEVLRTGSRVQAGCKEAGWTATIHSGMQGALWANQRPSKPPVVATEEAQFSGFNTSLGAVAGGGRATSPPGDVLHRGSCWRPCSWPSVHRQKCSRQRCQAERTSHLRHKEHHSSKRYSLI